jgi:hypothetical protein
VTFTGEINFTFDATFGGPSFYGIEPGDLFSSVLTYDPGQPNLSTVQGEGQYGVYDYTVTVQTAGGPVTLGGPISWPCVNCADVPIYVDAPSAVNAEAQLEQGGFAAFTFEGNNVISDDSLADVDWQNLLTLSAESQGAFLYPTGSLVQGGVHVMFLRASNAGVAVVGTINDVSVLDISSAPEPATVLLFGSALSGIALMRIAVSLLKSR